METEKNKLDISSTINNDDASDSDSDSDSTYTLTPLNVGQLHDLKKDYVAHAEGRLRHIIETEKEITKIDKAHIAFEDLLTIENSVLTIDLEKTDKFRRVYNLREEKCGQIIEKTKSIYEQFNKDVLMTIDRANKKNLSKNRIELDKCLKEEGKLLGRSSRKEINKFVEFEEALNSYSIIPVEPSHSVIYQIGALYHVKERSLLTVREFRIAVSVRIKQLPDAFRWLEKEGKIIDLASDFDALAYQINDYLEEEEESELYAIACKRFKKRVKGIEHENRLKEQANQSLEQLDALAAIKAVENPLSIAGSSGKAEIFPEVMPQAKKLSSHFYPLLPEEIRELAKIVDIKGSLYLGHSMQSLVSDYQKTAKQAKKKELTPSEHMKYALQVRDVANKTVHKIEDNLINELPITYATEELFNKTQRISEEYKRKTNQRMPVDCSGNATEHFFSDYFSTLDKRLADLRETLKKYRKKNTSERVQACENEIEKYIFIKDRAETLKNLVLEKEVAIIIGSDLSIYEYGASTQVLDRFEDQLEGKDREALLKLKLDIEEKLFLKKEYSAIEELHKKERCLGGDKWKPLTQAFGSYLDRKIDLLTKGNVQAIDEHEQLVASIEADARVCSMLPNPMVFYQSPREKEEPKAKKVIKQGAMLAACLLD